MVHEHFDEQALRTWLNENAETYSKFKKDLEKMLHEPFWTALKGLDESDAETIEDSLPQIIGLLQEGELTLDELYEDATESGDTTAYGLCCYLHIDDGLNEIRRAMEQKLQQAETQEIIKGIDGFIRHHEQEIKSESEVAEDKELNLLTLRRWHYDHPQEYAEFVESFNRAYDGGTDFMEKGFCYVMEMFSFTGIQGIMDLVAGFVPGTDSFMQNMISNKNQLADERLNNIFESSLQQDFLKQKALHNNPHFLSTWYWLVFDDGFCKAADLLSKTMMGQDQGLWMQNMGSQFLGTFIHSSIDNAAYTKGQWREQMTDSSKKAVTSTLQEVKGRRGRREACLLLEEMILPENVETIVGEIGKKLSEWKEYNESDSILAYLFAALNKCNLLNETYAYRTFHYAMREKFPEHKISKGFDHAEALYHAIVKKSTDDYNASITQAQIDYGKKIANDISLQFRLLLSPDTK